MPNNRRFNLPAFPQHVVQRGNNGHACFAQGDDCLEYLSRLTAASARFGVAVHAYVLMSNHVHLLVTPATSDGIGKCMQSVGSGFVRSFNARHGRTGTLWDGRYFGSLVGTDAYLWACYRYIESNPVRAGLVPAPGDYPWSSHACNAYGRTDPLVTAHPAYLALGSERNSRCAAFRSFFDSVLAESDLADLRDRLRQERAFGSEAFVAGVEALTRRSPRYRPRGRPRADAARK